ncbi:hypothetical protein E1287_07340 [Actinomadura sp. KC06]|uniref:hypothetical protein n=1 Tax=Actinomadura sp. KC06 TaxID=2530369 RepID=UPI0010458D21|nr:hypothetical protein [Actinomadura sp. KC06]TDD37862.1 hypothetical protein E1287_07340 [Actinomadura sp. KC06]
MEAHESAVVTLGLYFSMFGHVRRPVVERQRDEGWETYKKGFELRFRLRPSDVDMVRALIARAGFRPPNTYTKGARLIQPVYDPQLVTLILRACGQDADPNTQRERSPERRSKYKPEPG